MAKESCLPACLLLLARQNKTVWKSGRGVRNYVATLTTQTFSNFIDIACAAAPCSGASKNKMLPQHKIDQTPVGFTRDIPRKDITAHAITFSAILTITQHTSTFG